MKTIRHHLRTALKAAFPALLAAGSSALVTVKGQAAEPKVLVDAAEAGDLARVRELLNAGTEVNAKDTRAVAAPGRKVMREGPSPAPATVAGVTPLHLAAMNGHAEVVAFLLERGADINSRLTDVPSLQPQTLASALDGATPLWLASASNHVAVVRLLLAKNADINAAVTTRERTVTAKDAAASEDVRLLFVQAEEGIPEPNGPAFRLFLADVIGTTDSDAVLSGVRANVLQSCPGVQLVSTVDEAQMLLQVNRAVPASQRAFMDRNGYLQEGITPAKGGVLLFAVAGGRKKKLYEAIVGGESFEAIGADLAKVPCHTRTRR